MSDLTARAEPPTQDSGSSWSDEGLDLVRGISGGMLFGVPLFYTMEVWWIGSHTGRRQMLLILALLLVSLLALNRAAGFRSSRDVRWADALQDSLEALAVGIVATALVMLVLRRISFGDPMPLVLGRILNECIPFCLGVGVARFILQGEPGMNDESQMSGESGSNGRGGDDDESSTSSDDGTLSGTAADIGAAVLGATFIGLSIAPTDEVPMLASAMEPQWQVLIVLASLVISYSVVFVAGFAGQDRRHRQAGVFQRPVTETLITYLVALAVSATLLWVFQRGLSPPDDLLARVVVLGLPAAVGGAVGRLAL